MQGWIEINKRRIGPGCPVYIVAEMSANHAQNLEQAVRIIEAAREAGADAVKLQTYTPDTITIPCSNEYFRISRGTPWEGSNLYDLYAQAYTPWEWHPRLQELACRLGLDFFSTPFDASAVDFLEGLSVPAYKIASFEAVDLPLLRKTAGTGKPILLATGMASLAELDEAVRTIRDAGGSSLALLKCTSAYPAPPEEMNLRTIPHMAEAFGLPAGLSDHTLGIAIPVAAVALGACIVEKHLTLSRKDSSVDASFSLDPLEFKAMVQAVRTAEKALGAISYGAGSREKDSLAFRRSLFVVKDVKAGERFNLDNVRSIRPAYGLHPRYLDEVLNRAACRDIQAGTPLSWDLVGS